MRPHIREAFCLRCEETFVPAHDRDLEHGVREDGEECGGTGRMVGVYYALGGGLFFESWEEGG